MIANPVVVPAHADLFVWTFALIAMLVEVRVVLRLLRCRPQDVRRLHSCLFLVQITTWFPFLVAVDAFERPIDAHPVMVIAALEAAVVAAETVLLRELTHGRLFARQPQCRRLGWSSAFGLAVAGNLASIATNAGVVLLVWSTVR